MERAKTLRHNPTDAKRKLWNRLRAAQLGVKFRRQHPVAGYFADFCCVEHSLIVELDGGQHDEVSDAKRTADLEQAGFRVLRFWNDEVLLRTDDVLEEIVRVLKQERPPHPSPLPRRRRGRGSLSGRAFRSLSPGAARGEGVVACELLAPSPLAQPGERVGVRGAL